MPVTRVATKPRRLLLVEGSHQPVTLVTRSRVEIVVLDVNVPLPICIIKLHILPKHSEHHGHRRQQLSFPQLPTNARPTTCSKGNDILEQPPALRLQRQPAFWVEGVVIREYVLVFMNMQRCRVHRYLVG